MVSNHLTKNIHGLEMKSQRRTNFALEKSIRRKKKKTNLTQKLA